MTSSVKVTAHCAASKEVQIHLNGVLHTTLQDTETAEVLVYDDREVSVKEVVKPTKE